MLVNRTRYNQLRNSPDIVKAKEMYLGGDRIGATRILAKYDIVDPRKDTRQHRKAEIEKKPEDQLLRGYNRAKLINLLRDAERNSSAARGMLLQIRLNTATGIKARFNSDNDKWNTLAADYFNGTFAHNCDFLDDDTLEDIAENIVAARFREGDCLAVFDPLGSGESKILVYEADQLPDLDAVTIQTLAERYSWLSPDCTCTQGVITDDLGRVAGYAATRSHGLLSADADSVMCYQRGSQAVLPRKKWRFDQYRGIPDFAASLADVLDCYDMRTKELQTAKLAASLAIVSESQAEQDAIADAAESADVGGLFSDDSDSLPASTTEDIVRDDEEDNGGWKELGELVGGGIKRAAAGEKISALDIDRPNLNAQEFYERVITSAGAGIGLGKCYATGEVNTSYTAFRGEMVMSWALFRATQKWLERHFLDWVAVKAIEYAIRDGRLPDPQNEAWKHRISWKFPTMPSVDPLKESQARISDIGAGFATYSGELGADWQALFDQLASEKSSAESKGLQLSPFTKMPGTETLENTPTNDEQAISKETV